MAQDGPDQSRRPQQQDKLPSEFMDIISPALQVGGLTGMSGLLVGAVGGVLRSTTPTLFALASGLQWFTLGTTFWATRTFAINSRGPESNEPVNKVLASAIAGGVSGGAGGLLRGRKNVVPGMVVFAIVGALGQKIYNLADSRKQAVNSDMHGRNSWLNSRWSPVKVLSDDEYEKLLQEKLLRVDAEISLLDESIQAVKDEERAKETGGGQGGRS